VYAYDTLRVEHFDDIRENKIVGEEMYQLQRYIRRSMWWQYATAVVMVMGMLGIIVFSVGVEKFALATWFTVLLINLIATEMRVAQRDKAVWEHALFMITNTGMMHIDDPQKAVNFAMAVSRMDAERGSYWQRVWRMPPKPQHVGPPDAETIP
jgi:hypothetical protein